ncbi:hypothetical protein WH47_03742 [Habropoda laboriosa]|uniref:Uncharacterized protein n=1 Tax=Habropoda laboriosa TaxID=597456 RepID=A0A0L7QVV4_9HYME|nr:hypothetical protein WH47_03742 [Habropoda laboriosa]
MIFDRDYYDVEMMMVTMTTTATTTAVMTIYDNNDTNANDERYATRMSYVL